ncbi:MAG: 3-hydroxyacyl-CoA dehydrogenase family protein [Elusimicrobiota bacterium]
MEVSNFSIQRVSILGAGEIGAALGARLARYGVKVFLATLHLDTLAKAEKKIKASLEFRAKEFVGLGPLEKKLALAQGEEKTALQAKIQELSRQMKELRDKWLANVTTIQDTNYNNLIDKLSQPKPQLVIECIREELLSKQSILRAWSQATDGFHSLAVDGRLPIVATTASSLSVAEICEPLNQEMQARFLNFHPFNPPDRMDLLEIATTDKTDPKVIEEVAAFSKALGFEPVFVKDSRGFIVNRILFAYLGEAVNLLERGEASFEQIVSASLDFGYSMDPFRLLDFVGLDVSEAIIANLHRSFAGHIEPPGELFKKLLGLGRYGNKSQKGFYNYFPKETLAPEAAAKLAAGLGVGERDVLALVKLGLCASQESMEVIAALGLKTEDTERLADLLARQRSGLDLDFLKVLAKAGSPLAGAVEGFDPLRLPLAMLNEAARIVEEGVASVADVDLAMDLGTRYPELKGAGVRLASGVYAISHEENREILKALYAKTKNPKRYAAGPFGWALRYGIDKAVIHLEALSERYGALYRPAQLLKDLQFGRLPTREPSGQYRTRLYKRAVIKPKGIRGPAPKVFEEGIVPTQRKLGAYQMRGAVIAADINANWKWGVRDYPIDLAKYHQESGTVGGSSGLVLVSEIGAELAAHGSIKPGDVGIMLSGKHDVITTEALGGSAQAHRSFRIHAYEAKDPLEGSYSQEVALDWSQFVKIEDGPYMFEDLAGVGLVYPTVQHAVNVLNLKKGDVLLVEGAVGATGAAALQTARARNAWLIGLVSSEERGQKAKEVYGAHAYINRTAMDSDEAYLSRVKEIVKELTGNKRPLDKVIAYSGQAMFARHVASVREGDPMDPADYGGQVAYFGAGETGFAIEISGTSHDTPTDAMFERLTKLRRERYRVPTMRHVLIVAGANEAETRDAIGEAKRRHADVIVVVFDAAQERQVRDSNLLAAKGWWPKAKTRDGVINLASLGIPLERMPDPPVILPDEPTKEQTTDYEAKAHTFQAYQRRCLIPFGKAIGEIWGKDSTGRPLNADISLVLADGERGEKILNYLMFTGFFTQIAYPNDSSRMRLRWHAAMGWMSQNALVLSKKAVLGTHYASPAESTAIVDWIMRGLIRPVEAAAYLPQEIGLAQESIGTGKNAVLIGVAKPKLRTLEEAYFSQEVVPLLDHLASPESLIRQKSAKKIYEAGLGPAAKAGEALERLGLRDLRSAPTIGIAVREQRFEALRKAWGLDVAGGRRWEPDLADVPAEQMVREFSIHFEGAHLDILTPTGKGVLDKYLARSGEGIQQVEFVVGDVAQSCRTLRERGAVPVYDEPRRGANGTLVNFVLVDLAGESKALVELVELVPGAKSGLFAQLMKEQHIRLFAKASGDRNPFHLDDDYARRSRFGARIAHGILTASQALSRLDEFAPGYRIASIEIGKFQLPVKIADLVESHVEVMEKNRDSGMIKLRFLAKNQNGEQTLEGLAEIVPAKDFVWRAGVCSSPHWAKLWTQGLAAFAVRPAPKFQVGERAALKASGVDSGCLKITEDTFRAFEILWGAGNPHLERLACLGPIGHTSALFAPGFVLAGLKAMEFGLPIVPGDILETRAAVSEIGATKSGKTLIKIVIDVVKESGEIAARGEVTKILADPTESKSSVTNPAEESSLTAQAKRRK